MNRDCEECIHLAKKSTVPPCSECGEGEQFEPFPASGQPIFGSLINLNSEWGESSEHKSNCATCKNVRTVECVECRELYKSLYHEDKDKHRPESEEATCYWCSYYHDDNKEPAESFIKRFMCANCSSNYPSMYEREERTMSKWSDYDRESLDGEDMNLREECLRKANECVNQSRRDKYGDLEDNFQTIANLWNAYLGAIAEDRCDLTGFDVAIMMNLMKVGRAATGIASDNYVDMAGYAACAYELMGGEDGE